MKKLINYHVPDQGNVGDLLSSPLKYFDFPGFDCHVEDIRAVSDSQPSNAHIIVGGGGLLYKRFLPGIAELAQAKKSKMIFWGVGQQRYGSRMYKPDEFDYSPYFENADLIGIRDYDTEYNWLPCVSCMHPLFDKPREIKHELVVLSHKKFRISFPGIPRMTNETNDLEKILDFLGSGETILTTSFHAAYWGTLLNRKVIVFPFNSKFMTMKHKPAIYPVRGWNRERWQLTLMGRRIFTLMNPGDVHTCDTRGWKKLTDSLETFPDSLEECRERNRWFYNLTMEELSKK